MADHDAPYKGEFPIVHDEAADSPRWLPALGFVLCLLAFAMAWRSATAEPAQDAIEPEPTQEAAAAPVEAQPPTPTPPSPAAPTPVQVAPRPAPEGVAAPAGAPPVAPPQGASGAPPSH